MLRDFQAYIGRSTQAGRGIVMVRVAWVSVSVRGANTQSGAGIAQVALSLSLEIANASNWSGSTLFVTIKS